MFIGAGRVPRAARLPTSIRRGPSIQPSDAPAYIQAMAPFDVLRLSDIAPSNGNDTMEDVFTGDYAEWLTSDPGASDLVALINEWCGGFKWIGGPEIVIHGGGHGGSANNAGPAMSMAGTSAPLGFTMAIPPSTVAQIVANSSTYTGGRPVSVHTYDGLVRAGDIGYRFGGSQYSNGNLIGDAWKVDLTTGAWTSLTSPGNVGSTTPSCVYDPGSGKVLLIPGAAPSNQWRFLDTSNDTWAGTSVPAEYAPYDCTSALDTSRSRVLSIGSDSGRRITLADVNWSGNSVTVATQAIPDLPSAMVTGISMFYDEDLDCYWAWGGTQASGVHTALQRINASTFAVTSHTLSQTLAVFAGSDYQGGYGRWAFVPNWRAIAHVTHPSSNTGSHIIKLPSS
jgi:hypothetical protein